MRAHGAFDARGRRPGTRPELPVAVVGAGPIGLAAAAHLHARGLPFVVFEAGAAAGQAVLEWGHVRLFSPWRHLVDDTAHALLDGSGWTRPDDDVHPLGRELVDAYISPLARHPAIAPHVRFGSRIAAVTRRGADKTRTAGRDALPFELIVRSSDGRQERVLARAVIDASGTWDTPNPLGPGIPALGEEDAAGAGALTYRIPDALGGQRAQFAGRSTLVVGAGHSAFNAVLDLATLAEHAPGTRVSWAVRRTDLSRLFGGGEADQLAARGTLGRRVAELVERGAVDLITDFRATRVRGADGIVVEGDSGDGATRALGPYERVVALTGFRPDLAMHREMRLELDPVVETTPKLAPLIDPNIHSCGTVRPHGAAELAHPEPGLFIVGMKSYGRAPTFLLLTGYEQVRSIVAWLDGDVAAAADVGLQLPETGVCTTASPGVGCDVVGTDAGVLAAASSCCG